MKLALITLSIFISATALADSVIVRCGYPFNAVVIQKAASGLILAIVGDGYSSIHAPCKQPAANVYKCEGVYRMSPNAEPVIYTVTATKKNRRFSAIVERSNSSGPMVFTESECRKR